MALLSKYLSYFDDSMKLMQNKIEWNWSKNTNVVLEKNYKYPDIKPIYWYMRSYSTQQPSS